MNADYLALHDERPNHDWHLATVGFRCIRRYPRSSWKNSVRVATTANGTWQPSRMVTALTATLATGDDILIKDQTTGGERDLHRSAGRLHARLIPTQGGTRRCCGLGIGGLRMPARSGLAPPTRPSIGTTATVWVKIYPVVPTLANTSRAMGSTVYTITTANTWETVNDGSDVTISLTAGTWILFAHVFGQIQGFTSDSSIDARLYNSTDSAEVPGSAVVCVDTWGSSGNFAAETGTIVAPPYVVASGTKTIKLQAMRLVGFPDREDCRRR